MRQTDDAPSQPTEPFATGGRERAEPSSEADPAPSAAEAPINRGSTIGRYLVLQRLGEGGMGVVYAAYDAELDRKVALKLLRPTRSGTGEGHARLLREAQAMARTSHPNVIAVHDVGTYKDQVFVAMDLVEGTTLSKWLKQERRPWRDVVRVFLDAGRGLKAAHDAGLVHRDFKPTNVLLGKDGRVFVTDFGLARLASDEEEPQHRSLPLGKEPRRRSRLTSEVTSEGVVMGTPRYMAPEQMRGDRVDARADQFSFCAALYYGLWGQHAFDPEQLAGAAAKAEGHPTAALEQDGPWTGGERKLIAEPPSTPRVPSRVRRAVLRGLAVQADQRFPSMEPLLEELSTAANPASTRAVYALGAAVALLVLGGVTWAARERARAQVCTGGVAELASTWNAEVAGSIAALFTSTAGDHGADQARRAQRALDAYAERWAAAHRDACEATRIRGEQTETILALRMTCLERKRKELAALVGLLGHPDPALVDKSVDAAYGLSGVGQCRDVDALTAVGRPDDPSRRDAVEQAEGRLAKVDAMRAAGRYADGLKEARSALAESQKLGFRPLEAQARFLTGTLLELNGDLRGGERELSEALFLAEAGRDEVTKLKVTTRLTYLVGDRMLRPEDGLRWSRLGEATLARIGADNYPDLESDLWNMVGNAHLRAGVWEKAVAAFQRSFAVVKKAGGNESRRVRALSNIATAQSKMGQRTESVASQREAIADMERLRGPDHPVLVRPLYNIANTLVELGEFKEAHAAVARALQLAEIKLGKDDPTTADVLDTYASLLLEEGRAAEAFSRYRRALEIKQKTLAPGNALFAFTYDGLGRSLLALGKPREAADWLERAASLNPGDDTVMADIRFGLARALWASGHDRARARALALQAQESFERLNYARRVAAVSVWLSEPGRK